MMYVMLVGLYVTASPANALVSGCSTTEPTQLPASAVRVTDSAALGDVTTCRSTCFLKKLNVVVFSSSKVPIFIYLLTYLFTYMYILIVIIVAVIISLLARDET